MNKIRRVLQWIWTDLADAFLVDHQRSNLVQIDQLGSVQERLYHIYIWRSSGPVWSLREDSKSQFVNFVNSNSSDLKSPFSFLTTLTSSNSSLFISLFKFTVLTPNSSSRCMKKMFRIRFNIAQQLKCLPCVVRNAFHRMSQMLLGEFRVLISIRPIYSARSILDPEWEAFERRQICYFNAFFCSARYSSHSSIQTHRYQRNASCFFWVT